jgi:hypothetical protein
MKIKLQIVITILFFAFASKTFGQNAYDDAVRLKPYLSTGRLPCDQRDLSLVFSILKNYCADSIKNEKSALQTTIENQFKSNPFLSSIVSPGHPDDFNSPSVASATSGLASTLSNFGGLNVTTAANGIADLLIDRAKQELTIAFFNRLRTLSEKHREFKTLFPKTTDNLTTMPPYNYAAWISALRTGFNDDLQNVPGNLDALLKVTEIQPFLKKYPEISVAIRTISLVYKVKSGENVANALNDLSNFPEITNNDGSRNLAFKNFANSVRLISIFSQALRNSDTTKLYVSTSQINDVVKDDTTFNIFLGLIYQQVYNAQIQFYYTVKDPSSKKDTVKIDTFKNIMVNLPKFTDIFVSVENNLVNIAQKVVAIKNDIDDKKKNKEKITDTDYYNYINSAIDVISYGFNIAEKFDSKLSSNDLNNYAGLAKKADDVYLNIYKAQYPQALLNFVYILDHTPAGKDKSIVKLSNFISTYGLFIVNVVDAKTPADVQAAINNAILPVGSYSIKQNSYFNVSLNAYLGYAFNFKNLQFATKNFYSQGIYAPIGFSLSKSFGNISVTGFLGLADLGSVVSYRLNNVNATGTTTSTTGTSNTSTSATVNTSTSDQQIKLGSLYSPSAQLFFEFKGWPFAVGGGWRKTPTLFYSSGTTYSTVGSKSVFTATVLIDIPFFTFYNNPKNK